MLSTLGAKLNLVLTFLLFAAALAIPDPDVDTAVTIPLNKTLTYDNREIYGEFMKLNSSTLVKFNFTDLSPNFTFLIFQVHSHFHPIILYQNKASNATQIYGTNVGLMNVFQTLPNAAVKLDTFYVQNPHTNISVRVYVSVHVYEPGDPYPGGCNMEFPTPIAPYLNIKTNDDYITIDAAPPANDSSCMLVAATSITFYSMYLPEMNFYADDYFSGIRNMMTLKNIENYGTKIPKTFWSTRRLLSAYPGTGVIVVAVARPLYVNQNRYAVYVPNHSYGCQNLSEDGCEIADDMLSQILCVALLFIGLFVSFFGHRFFKTEMFLCGLFSGFIITYILVYLMERTIDTPALVAAAAISGIFFGAIWLLFWWLYAIPVVSVSLVTLDLGFIIASIFYYTLPVQMVYFEKDLNFWALFTMVMSLTALALLSVTYAANILCCAALGGFATMYAVDFFMGSNLKYIMINIVRRAIVPNFNYVVVSPPYLWRDIMVTFLGLMVAMLGWSFQHWHNLGRPPFPPPPRSTRPAAPDQPTYYGAVIGARTEPILAPAVTSPTYSESTSTPKAYNERSRLLAT